MIEEKMLGFIVPPDQLEVVVDYIGWAGQILDTAIEGQILAQSRGEWPA
jgi:hypothetical protein